MFTARRELCPKEKVKKMDQGWGTAWLEECRKSGLPSAPAQHKLGEMVHAYNPSIGWWRETLLHNQANKTGHVGARVSVGERRSRAVRAPEAETFRGS